MNEQERASLKPGDTVYVVMGHGTEGPYRRQWQACKYTGTEPILTLKDGTPRDLAWMEAIRDDEGALDPIPVGAPWGKVHLEPGELLPEDGEE